MEARHLSWCLVSNQSKFSLSFFPLYLAITSVLPYIVLCDFVYVSCGLVKELNTFFSQSSDYICFVLIIIFQCFVW